MADRRVVSRMKKELERLKKDPPHGVTCWSKEGRLNHLEANLLGAGGTPYEDGVFKVEIKIPNNYPFEPPHVQFLTKIYHPNIDTAGRICLDVLKSPPTGSWKPTHNLNLVLASIQLLLTEPNPDDGLMADISNEYKNNRPTFVAKAKEWTCRYARNVVPSVEAGADDTHVPDTTCTQARGGDSLGNNRSCLQKEKKEGEMELTGVGKKGLKRKRTHEHDQDAPKSKDSDVEL